MTDLLLSQTQNDCDFYIKYKINKKPIGKGSFATVYLGTDKYNKFVAIKQISLSKIKSTYMDKFLRELDISMKLDHPNIVKCYEIFKTEKHWYIVNEYCDCGTLQDLSADLLKHDPHQREYIVRKLLNELKDALKYLISNNIIHRDLKPSNILIKKTSSNNYTIKLADFGFARYFTNEISDEGHDDMVNTLCGSPIYMAPELLINLKYNMKADLWSFGVIMYELLYGTNPYYFPKNITELRRLMIEKEITYPNLFSIDCIDLMKSLLIIEPEKRINWKKFFLHQWFINLNTIKNDDDDENKIYNAQIKNSPTKNYVTDIISKLIPTEINSVAAKEINKQSEEKTDDYFGDLLFATCIDPKYKEESFNEFDFELVNIDDLDDNQIPEYNTYHESSTSSLIKILSNSIRSLWNYGNSPSNSPTSISPVSFGKSPPSYGTSPPSYGTSPQSYGKLQTKFTPT